MPLNHDNATAKISITGLVLSCYNSQSRNLELGFIRHSRHVLTIEIKSPSASGETRTKFEIDDNHKIYLDAINAIPPAQPLFVRDGEPFDRTSDGNDSEDLRWIVDFDNEFNGGQPVRFKQAELPVTPMFIAEPVLYTVATSKFVQDLKLVQADNPKVDVAPFGKLANNLGADISCRPGGGVRIRVEGPLPFSIFLPAGAKHEIVIDNNCPPSPSGGFNSDFNVYYSIVDDSTLAAGKVDFALEHDDELGAGAICNPALLGKTGRLYPAT